MAYAPDLFTDSLLVCPAYRALGLHCPGCGMTRALACLVRFDLLAAVRFNPLVLLVAPIAVVLVLDSLLTASGRTGIVAGRSRLLRRSVPLLLVGVTLLFAVRMASWLVPDCNPAGWCLPPAEFPPR